VSLAVPPPSSHAYGATNSASIEDAERKATKKKNKHGNPIKLPSKILAITADLDNSSYVYVAEAAGTAKHISIDVSPYQLCSVHRATKQRLVVNVLGL
jgi:hypothetical protein